MSERTELIERGRCESTAPSGRACDLAFDDLHEAGHVHHERDGRSGTSGWWYQDLRDGCQRAIDDSLAYHGRIDSE